jgi:thiol:disulfide interchange protein DsbD
MPKSKTSCFAGPRPNWPRRPISVLPFLLLAALPVIAQTKHPVSWTLEPAAKQAAPGGKILLRFTASIDEGWHLYAPTTPPGPIPTAVTLAEHPAVASVRLFQPEPVRKFDPNFNNESLSYDKQAVFLLEATLKPEAGGKVTLRAETRYQVCSDTVCLRPVRRSAETTVEIAPGANAAVTIPPGYSEVKPAAEVAAPEPAPAAPQSEGFAWFLLGAFGYGLAAIFTPCVFPMIPFTVSAFLGQTGSPIPRALTFCLGIVATFTALGLGASLLLGPFGAVQIGSNPWVNGFVALIFAAFALSLLGAYEITLPSGLVNRMNEASQGAGLLPLLLMGLTFSLTSFACVGPFMGTLLAATVQSGGWRPALGMASFAAGLASPFFLLAIFPGYLQKLPRSGGWLMRVKVVLGFLVLAASVKYLSSVDEVMHWGLLSRERFLAVWIVLFALPGLYLLGLLRMEGVKSDENVGAARALIGAAFLIFSVSLLPGMFGARLGEIDAFVPSAKETLFGAASSASKSAWIKDDYQGALARARAESKPLLVQFTGYACTNCKWMKSNMFPRPEIAPLLDSFVLAELYTDGSDAASEANRQLQEGRFQTVAIPHYVVLDANERVLASHVGLTKKTEEFLRFLQKGLGRS